MATRVTDLENPQQMELVVSGPEGAKRLIICTGMAPIDQAAANNTTTQVWTWLVGPVLTHPQFYRAVADGALCKLAQSGRGASWFINSVDADWDDESGRVELRAEVQITATGTDSTARVQGITYHVSILALHSESVIEPPAATTALTITPASFDFGPVPVDDSSAETIIIVSNTGSQGSGPLEFALTVAGPDLGGFAIVSNPCAGAVLAPGASGALNIRFLPTSLGAKAAVLTVNASPGGSASLGLTGAGWAPATIEITPKANDYGRLSLDTGSLARFALRNTGRESSGPLEFAVTGAHPDQFTIVSNPGAGSVLAPGASVTLTVRFSPAFPGAKWATLRVYASPGSDVTSDLTGIGADALEPATLSLAPIEYDFGALGNTASFTVTNNGSTSSGILSVAVTGADATYFAVIDLTPAQPLLAPGASALCTVRFARPLSLDLIPIGAKTASLAVSASPGGIVASGLYGIDA